MLNDATHFVRNLQSRILRFAADSLYAQWAIAGGCTRCHGHGQVVTWSTLDGASWTEYGTCTACTDASRAVGRAPNTSWHGGYSAAGRDNLHALPANAHADDVARLALVTHVADRFRDAEERERYRVSVRKGARVEVFKGRKVPIGTCGVVIWIGDGQYGMRCGVKDAAGAVHWTACDNVRVSSEMGAPVWPEFSPETLARLCAIVSELSEGRGLLHPVRWVNPIAGATVATLPAALQAPAAAPKQVAPCTTADRFAALEIDDKRATIAAPVSDRDWSKIEID
jgi:hypothetical protein